MTFDLSSVTAATTLWLTRSFPAPGGALSSALAEAQARQAVTVAAHLRYPSPLDAELVTLAGPGGSHRLDRLNRPRGTEASGTLPAPAARGPRSTAEDLRHAETERAWRTWVDEVLASWAACLLTAPRLAGAAVAAVTTDDRLGTPAAFRRLTAPDAHDLAAAPLLRHPDLVARIADLHRAELHRYLAGDQDPEAGPAALTND